MNLSQTNIEQAYELDYNLDRFEGYGEEEYSYDAEVIGKDRYETYIYRYFYRPELITEFKKLELRGGLSMLEEIDYLYTKPSLPIMSKRMLYILKAMGDFPHQEIPVVIQDDEADFDRQLKEWIGSGKVNNNYVAVHILEHLDIFDRENSIYEPGIFDPNRVRVAKKLVLHEPEGGLPPLFKLKVMPGRLFVSPEAKLALEESGITGIDFIPKTTK